MLWLSLPCCMFRLPNDVLKEHNVKIAENTEIEYVWDLNGIMWWRQLLRKCFLFCHFRCLARTIKCNHRIFGLNQLCFFPCIFASPGSVHKHTPICLDYFARRLLRLTVTPTESFDAIFFSFHLRVIVLATNKHARCFLVSFIIALLTPLQCASSRVVAVFEHKITL